MSLQPNPSGRTMAFRSRNSPDSPSSLPVRFDVVFVLPHMGRGGAQRVTSLVANAWSRQGKRICILTWDDQKEDAHELDPAIVRIDTPSFARELVRRAGLVRRARVEIQHHLRKAEQWIRPRLSWRGRNKRVELSISSARGGDGDGGGAWWSSRYARRNAASIVTWLERRKTRQPALRAVWEFGRTSFSRFVLGYRVRDFRDAFSELNPQVIVSLLTKTNLYVLEAVRGMNIRVVISERNDPDLQTIAPDLAALRCLNYRVAYAVTSNSSGILEKLAAYVPSTKLKLLPNPILVSLSERNDALRSNRFVTVARLVHQKGVDLLLAAFAEVADIVRDWTLEIVGDGPLRERLTEQAKELGIDDRVTFHGHLPDPMTILRLGRVFVLPSRFEGMPNALLEAMACGLAPIVTDASPGPLESVKHNESGLVVRSEDVSALAEAMRLLASDDGMTDRLAEQAGAYIKKHDWSVIEAQWLQVLGIGADEGAKKTTQLAVRRSVVSGRMEY